MLKRNLAKSGEVNLSADDIEQINSIYSKYF